MHWLFLAFHRCAISCAIVCSICASVYTPPAQADPKSHYMIHCMGCHLPGGHGLPPEVPAFSDQLGKLVSTPEGKQYLVQVPGASQALLNDNELAHVLNWILTEYSRDTLPENFEFYTGSEVSRYRKNILADPGTARIKLLGTY
jgi:hypothetical protein